jgi:hypothetical protein
MTCVLLWLKVRQQTAVAVMRSLELRDQVYCRVAQYEVDPIDQISLQKMAVD